MKRNLKKICGLLGAALIMFGMYGRDKANDTKYCVSSYLRTWPIGSTQEDIAKGKHWKSSDIKGEYLTDLIISFAHVDQDTWGIKFPDVDNAEHPFPELWNEVKTVQKKYPHIKMHVSVGGWGADGFSDMAADSAKRQTFISALVNLLDEKNLDGIDIDWEYPVGPDWGQAIKSSSDDGVNFLTLLSEMRTEFNKLGNKTGKSYIISCAVPNSGWYVQKIDVVKLAGIVDSMKLMSYDYYGSWSGQTGHHANLMNNPKDPDWGGWSTDQGIRMYLDAGVPAEKLILGVAYYGRAWQGVKDNGVHGLYQKYEKGAYDDGLSWPDLQPFLKKNSGYVRYWDDVAKAPYLYNGDVFITYTDKEAIGLIGDYVKEKGLGGVMNWEYGHDIKCDLGRTLYESVNK